MENKLIQLLSIFLISLIVGLVFGWVIFDEPKMLGGWSDRNMWTSDMTNSSFYVTTSCTTTAIARNTDRQYLALGNKGDNTIYLWFLANTTTTQPVHSQGYMLTASSTLVFDADNLFQGAIFAITESGNSILTISEK